MLKKTFTNFQDIPGFDLAYSFLSALNFSNYVDQNLKLPKEFIRNIPFYYLLKNPVDEVIAFLHVEKTAGSTFTELVELAETHAIYRGIFSETILCLEDQIELLCGFLIAVKDRRKIFLCGHYDINEYHSFLNFENNIKLITFVREPSEIVYSLYTFMIGILRKNKIDGSYSAESTLWYSQYNTVELINFSFLEWLECDATIHNAKCYQKVFAKITCDINASDLIIFNGLISLLLKKCEIIESNQFNKWFLNSQFSTSRLGLPLSVVTSNKSDYGQLHHEDALKNSKEFILKQIPGEYDLYYLLNSISSLQNKLHL